jgi:hypothetical protein
MCIQSKEIATVSSSVIQSIKNVIFIKKKPLKCEMHELNKLRLGKQQALRERVS